jgi:hypothetical protein
VAPDRECQRVGSCGCTGEELAEREGCAGLLNQGGTCTVISNHSGPLIRSRSRAHALDWHDVPGTDTFMDGDGQGPLSGESLVTKHVLKTQWFDLQSSMQLSRKEADPP